MELPLNRVSKRFISSYFATGYQGTREMAADYDPYPETIYVYGNRMSGGGSSPDGLDLKALKVAMFGLNGAFPDVRYLQTFCLRVEQSDWVDGGPGAARPPTKGSGPKSGENH